MTIESSNMEENHRKQLTEYEDLQSKIESVQNNQITMAKKFSERINEMEELTDQFKKNITKMNDLVL